MPSEINTTNARPIQPGWPAQTIQLSPESFVMKPSMCASPAYPFADLLIDDSNFLLTLINHIVASSGPQSSTASELDLILGAMLVAIWTVWFRVTASHHGLQWEQTLSIAGWVGVQVVHTGQELWSLNSVNIFWILHLQSLRFIYYKLFLDVYGIIWYHGPLKP